MSCARCDRTGPRPFSYLEERFGDRQATRYQEASFNVQPTENVHIEPTRDAERELYDPDYPVLKLADPYSYSDPRQYYYTPYVAAAAARHESFAQTLKYIEDRRLLDKLPDSFQITLRGFVLPLRHYESGAQLIALNGSRFAWGTTVEQPIAFAAMDRMGDGQQLSLVGLAMAGGAGDTLAEAKKNWLFSGPLQGIRKAMEELLVEGDWAVGVIGLDLIDELLHPVVFEHLDDRALARGAVACTQLARHFGDWYRNHRKFMASLLKAWATDPEHGESNREAMGDIAGRWFPIVHTAVAEYAVGIAEAAGSTTAVAAVERSSAELTNQLKKLGVHVRAVQEGVRSASLRANHWHSAPRSADRASARECDERGRAPERKTRLVGVDLQDSSDSHAVVEAIEADNTGVTVNRMPGLVSLRAAREMVIRRESVEARIGREWDTQEFQMNLVSYSGNIDWDDDQIIIKWEH